MTKKKLALYDLDGTLYDTVDVNYYAYSEAAAEEGYEIDYSFYRKECNGRHYRYFLPLIGVSDLGVMEKIHDKKKQYYSKYLNRAKENTHLFEMIKLLQKDYDKVVVTTASRKNTEEILAKYGRLGLFSGFITQEDTKKVKPDPEGFLLAMKQYGAAPKDTVIFEDSDVGIEAAYATGASVFRVMMFDGEQEELYEGQKENIKAG